MVEDTTHPIENTYCREFLFKPSSGYAKTAKVPKLIISNKQTRSLDTKQIIFYDIVYCFLKDVNLVEDDK